MKTIKKGDNGAATLQQALGITADGNFGTKTDEAVRAFQLSHGLAIDGVVGPKTWEALKVVPAAEAPEPAAPSTGHAIGMFTEGGWYASARRFPAMRAGGHIEAMGVVTHTTDEMPGSMPGIVKRWATEKGNGSCAHFMIGRRAPTADELLTEEWPSAGVVQMIPITKNGNHVGGSGAAHLKIFEPGVQRAVHPNTRYIGIELDCGGKLTKTMGRSPDPAGAMVPIYWHNKSRKVDGAEVVLDAKGNPWHLVTAYQYEQLGLLLDALHERLPYFPAGTRIEPNGSYKLNGVLWGAMPGIRFIGHVTADPIQKNDPGPMVMQWLRERYGAL